MSLPNDAAEDRDTDDEDVRDEIIFGVQEDSNEAAEEDGDGKEREDEVEGNNDDRARNKQQDQTADHSQEQQGDAEQTRELLKEQGGGLDEDFVSASERRETLDGSSQTDSDEDEEEEVVESDVEHDSYEGADATLNASKSAYGMSSWMQRTLSTAVKAQSQLGELLARPGRLYKELNQENVELRRRVAEISVALSHDRVELAGDLTTGSVIALKDKVSGAAIGVQNDNKLMEITWTRAVPHNKNSGNSAEKEDKLDQELNWEIIPEAASVGYYRLTVDDVDHCLRADVRMKDLFWRLLPDSSGDMNHHAENGSSHTNGTTGTVPQVSPAPSPSAASTSSSIAEGRKIHASASSVSLASAASSGSHGLNGHARESILYFSPEGNEVVTVSDQVASLVKDLMKRSKVLQFDGFKNRADPANDAQLIVNAKKQGDLNVLVRRAPTKSQALESAEDPDDPASEAIEASFPAKRLQVYCGGTHARAINLVLDEKSVLLHARANAERDAVVLLIRERRKTLRELPRSYDFEPTELFEPPRIESTSVSVSGAGSVAATTEHGQQQQQSQGPAAVDCAYSEVWKYLEYPALAQAAHDIQSSSKTLSDFPVTTPGAAFSAIARRFSTRSIPSMFGVVSSSKVPPASPRQDQGRKTRADSKSSEPKELTPPPVPPEEMPASFDLYSIGGFGERFDVEVNMIDGEGLGITLSLFDVVRKPNDDVFPERGATCVCISGFCPTVVAGEESLGQLEKSKRVRIGDALVAINGIPVEPSEPVRKRKDLRTYEKCTLRRVAELVERERLHGREESERIPNPAARMTFTFAEGLSGQAVKINSHLKLREELEEYKTKLYEANARASALVMQCEQRLEKQGARTRKLCEVVDEARAESERANTERTFVLDECINLKKQLHGAAEEAKVVAGKHNEEIDALKEEIGRLNQRKEDQVRHIKQLEASMESLANEGEAWVNTIGTKEDALRALEKEMRAMQIKYENSQSLLDNATAERERIRMDVSSRDEQITKLKEELAASQTKLEEANDEADKLTARIRSEADEAANAIERAKHSQKTAAAELETMRGQLSVAQSHARALKEANASAEQRATEASSARQAAEMALHEQKELVALAHKQIAQLEEQLRNERTVHERMRRDRTGLRSPSASISNTEESGTAPASGDAGLDEDTIRREEQLKKRNRELEAANDLLRSQVKSLKSRVQGLSAEVTKVTQMDAIVAEKNDLMVQVKLEEAKRLEAEDELTAYKGALLKYARQAQKDEQEGHGEPWTNRPKIFDHLYKTLLAEEEGSKKMGRGKPSYA